MQRNFEMSERYVERNLLEKFDFIDENDSFEEVEKLAENNSRKNSQLVEETRLEEKHEKHMESDLENTVNGKNVASKKNNKIFL